MNDAPIRGVAGLLDRILSSEAEVPTSSRRAIRPRNTPHPDQARSAATHPFPVTVRRGRPPGKAATACLKEKVTVRLTGTLIASYRDWTWETRCQLSQLVERALAEYRQRRRQRPAEK